MQFRPARATDVYKFRYFDTPDADDATAEVESWVRRDAWAWFRDPSGADEDRQLLVADASDGGLMAVVAHHRFEPGARYLLAILLAHESRENSHGEELFKQALEMAAIDGSVFWTVRESNHVALHISRKHAASEASPTDGHITFTTP